MLGARLGLGAVIGAGLGAWLVAVEGAGLHGLGARLHRPGARLGVWLGAGEGAGLHACTGWEPGCMNRELDLEPGCDPRREPSWEQNTSKA